LYSENIIAYCSTLSEVISEIKFKIFDAHCRQAKKFSYIQLVTFRQEFNTDRDGQTFLHECHTEITKMMSYFYTNVKIVRAAELRGMLRM